MIIIRETRRKNWYDDLLEYLSTDDCFDTLTNILDGYPYAQGAPFQQAVQAVRRRVPSAPSKEIASSIAAWIEHHEDMLRG